ncbi:efflux RND transporter permease subunit [Leptospira andrefontaineae]|uniref:Efflux RND transporter permease subunit n=1 Tax=Leptospira andrefontaineae TaxID=2484976 RepID=A0A4R9HAN1_9LEPT|nr:efflux RND transporter permease subunit [Leptospira andrefontaineae]TGK43531.1 efflux RND transporter permease subunit [Leptospira andrefontaineae]
MKLNPITSWMILSGILVLGLASSLSLSYGLFPTFKYPGFTISVEYPGADAETVESIITVPIEEQISGIGGIVEMRSYSEKGLSQIRIEFESNSEMLMKGLELREKIEIASAKFPKDSRKPLILNYDPDEMPVLVLSLNSSQISLKELRTFADNELKKEIEGVEGISKVSISGGKITEILISCDMQKLSGYGINFSDLQRSVQGYNINSTIGEVEASGILRKVRLTGKFESLDEIRRLPILGLNSNRIVLIKDVADVTHSYRDEDSSSRINGKENIGLYIYVKHGANVLRLSSEIQKLIEKRRSEEYHIRLIYDRAEAVGTTYQNIIFFSFIGLSTLLCLHYLKNKKEISGSLISVVIQSLLLFFIFSFLSFIRKKEFDLLPIISILVGVFYCLNLKKMTGKKKEIPRIDLIFSSILLPGIFLTSYLHDPSLMKNLFEIGILSTISFLFIFYTGDFLTNSINHLKVKYGFALYSNPVGTINYPIVVSPNEVLNKKEFIKFLLCLVLLLFSLHKIWSSKKELFFNLENDRIFGYIDLPSGTGFSFTNETSQKVEDKILTLKGVKEVITQISPSHAFLIINYKTNSLFEGNRIENLKKVVGDQNPAFCYFTQESEMGRVQEISMDVIGDSSEKLNAIVPEIARSAGTVKGVKEVVMNFKSPRDELRLEINNRDNLINSAEIGGFLKTIVQGAIVSRYTEESRETDIRIRSAKEYRQTESQLNKYLIRSQFGKLASLEGSYEPKEGKAPVKLYRKNKRPVLSFSVKTDFTSPSSALLEIKKAAASYLPEGYRIELNDKIGRISKSGSRFLLSVFLNLAILFFAFASYSESLTLALKHVFSISIIYISTFAISAFAEGKIDLGNYIGSNICLVFLFSHIIFLTDKENISLYTEKIDELLKWIFLFSLPLLIFARQGGEFLRNIELQLLLGLTLAKFLLVPSFNFSNRLVEWLVKEFNRRNVIKFQFRTK